MKNALNLLIISFLSLLFISCQPTETFYKKEIAEADKAKLAEQLIAGRGNYYQGSPGEQLLLRESEIMNPNSGTLWREYGVPYLKRGFAAEFYPLYEKAVKLDPLGWAGWRGYLYLYFYRDYERAIADFDMTDELTPGVVDYPQSLSVNYMRGICYLMLENYEKSLEYFEMHFKHESESAGVEYLGANSFVYKGLAHWKSGQIDEAIEVLELGVKHNPSNADVKYWLAKILFEEKKSHTHPLRLARNAVVHFKKNDFNSRGYTEDFYQLYLPQLEKLERVIYEASLKESKSL